MPFDGLDLIIDEDRVMKEMVKSSLVKKDEQTGRILTQKSHHEKKTLYASSMMAYGKGYLAYYNTKLKTGKSDRCSQAKNAAGVEHR